MITYEQAKQLKDAGFPQEGIGEWVKQDMSNPSDWETNNVVIYIPTLSELIKACGHVVLEIREDGKTSAMRSFRKYMNFEEIPCEGSTPEEAVINLYLELHK